MSESDSILGLSCPKCGLLAIVRKYQGARGGQFWRVACAECDWFSPAHAETSIEAEWACRVQFVSDDHQAELARLREENERLDEYGKCQFARAEGLVTQALRALARGRREAREEIERLCEEAGIMPRGHICRVLASGGLDSDPATTSEALGAVVMADRIRKGIRALAPPATEDEKPCATCGEVSVYATGEALTDALPDLKVGSLLRYHGVLHKVIDAGEQGHRVAATICPDCKPTREKKPCKTCKGQRIIPSDPPLRSMKPCPDCNPTKDTP